MDNTIKVNKIKYKELLMIEEDYKSLKEEIESLYNSLKSIEIIREYELSKDDDIEEI